MDAFHHQDKNTINFRCWLPMTFILFLRYDEMTLLFASKSFKQWKFICVINCPKKSLVGNGCLWLLYNWLWVHQFTINPWKMLLGNKCFFNGKILPKKRNSNFKIQKSSDFRFFHSLEVTPKKNSENCQISILGFLCVAKV